MAFDVQGALKAGYTEMEIAAELAREKGFDFDAAVQSGYSPSEIIQELNQDSLGPAKAVGAGVARGAIGGTVGLPGDLLDMVGKGGVLPTTKSIMDTAGINYQPVGRDQRFMADTAEGAGSMALPFGKLKTAARLGLGATAGAVGSAGGELAGPTGEIFGQIAVLLPAAITESKRPQIVKAIQDYLSEVGPEGLRDSAAAAKVAARVLGTEVLIPQGAKQLGPLAGITNEIARSPQGARVRRVLERQLPVGQEKIDELIGSIATGKDLGKDEANRVAAAVNKAMERPQEVRSYAVKDSYRKAGKDTVDQESLLTVLTKLDEQRRGAHLPKTSDSGRAVTQTQRKVAGTMEGIQTPEGEFLLDAKGNPIVKPTSVLDLDTIKKEAAAKAAAAAKPEASGADIAKKVGHETAAGVIRREVREASPDLKRGQDLYDRFSLPVEKTRKSALGDMQTAASLKKDEGLWKPLKVALDNPNEYSPKDIADIGERLRKADPQAFPILVKQHLTSKLSESGGKVGGRVDEEVLGNFPDAVMGPKNSQQRGNFREMMRQSYLAQGLDPERAAAATKGAENVMEALEVIARERKAMGSVSTDEMRREAGMNLVSRMFKTINPISPGFMWGGVIERAVQRETYRRIADALVDPEKVDLLINAAKWNATDVRTKAAVRNLAGLSGMNSEEN